MGNARIPPTTFRIPNSNMPVYLLSETLHFPHPSLATPEGLLAVGGDLRQDRLLTAYSYGIFPWFSDNEPIMWWSPNPRLVLFPQEFKVSKTLKKIIRKNVFQITVDQAFEQVIVECARIRAEKNEPTWIVEDMIDAYCRLHESGYAHSIEAWSQGNLAGGLYGVSLGRCFFGESMFTRRSNASKVALAWLVRYLRDRSFPLIDCQVTTNHLISLGAREIPRQRFLRLLQEALQTPTLKGRWS
jgi:leucyl/phenylalanyl-tRNA--protein transferase